MAKREDALMLIRNNFDKMIYCVSRKTGISFTANIWKKLLIAFYLERAYTDKRITTDNLPYLFMLSPEPYSLFGSRIKNNSDLLKAIQLNCPTAMIQSSIKEGSSHVGYHRDIRLNLTFQFTNYKKKKEGSTEREYISLEVKCDNRVIYEDSYLVDNTLSLLIGRDRLGRWKKNKKMLDTAQSIMPLP